MRNVFVICLLLVCYTAYSCWIYRTGTDSKIAMPPAAIAGKSLWQSRNCQNCHQVFGLGGYMGPDLTTVCTDRNRGTVYAKAMITNGSARMPDLNISEAEAEQLLAWLSYAGELSRNGVDK